MGGVLRQWGWTNTESRYDQCSGSGRGERCEESGAAVKGLEPFSLTPPPSPLALALDRHACLTLLDHARDDYQ